MTTTLDDILTSSRPIVATTEKGRPTGAWAYLASRGIDPSRLPECIKSRSNALGREIGALVAEVEDRKGNVVGAQQIFITPGGNKAPITNFTGDSGKRSYGKVKGYVVRLPGSSPEINYHACSDEKTSTDCEYHASNIVHATIKTGTLRGVIPIVCEGVETGLSIWQALDCKREVWCTVGVKNLGYIPDPAWSTSPINKKMRQRILVVFADADADGTQGHTDLGQGIHRLHKRDVAVLLARPQGDGGRDANDVLQQEGADAVRRLVGGSMLTFVRDYDALGPESSAGVDGAPSKSSDGRARIQFSEVNLTSMLDETEAALRERNAPVYQRGGALAHVYRLNRPPTEDDDIKRPVDALGIHEMVPLQLRECIHNHVQFWLPGKDDEPPVDIAVPMRVVNHTAARSERWRLRPLRGIIEVPAMRPDGSIITEDGYDEATGLLLDTGGIEYPPIPERPTQEQLADALNALRQPFQYFPFVPDDDSIIVGSREALEAPSASRSVILSGVLTALSRHLMRQAPLHATSAPSVGTGKSYLADGIAIIATGRTAAVMNYTGDEAEDEKRLTGVLMQGDTVLSIDNVEKELSGSFLCQMFTQDSVQVRVLGSTGQHRLSTAVTTLANGNGLRFGGDMADRGIMCNIDAGIERPGEREFNGDFRADMLAQRPLLVTAGLTLLRGYIVAGRRWQDHYTTSRFADWDHLVRGCLLWMGEPDPYATKEQVMATDSTRESLDIIVEAMRENKTIGTEWFSSQDLVVYAKVDTDLDAALRGIMPFGKEPTAKALSTYLQKNRNRIIGDLVIRGEKDSVSKRWKFALRPATKAMEPAGPRQKEFAV